MQNAVSDIEKKAAREISHFAHREFGLAEGHAVARLLDHTLTVRLNHSLTPLGKLLLETASEDGSEALESFYETAYARCHHRLETLIARITGVEVPRSSIEVDTRYRAVFF